MKRMLILILSLMLLGCVPTPEEEFVVGKGGDYATAAPDAGLLAYWDMLPAGWTQSLSLCDGAVRVTIDAEIDAPQVDRFPIVEVVPASIDVQIAARLLNALVPNGSIRISDHGGQAYSLEDVDQWIEAVKQQLAHTDGIAFDSIEERDDYIDAQNAELERLFEMRKSAVSGTVTTLSDYALLGRCDTMECSVLDADGAECANLLWKPQSGDGQDKRESVLHIDSLTAGCALLDHGVQSTEEAIRTADALLEEIGLSERYARVSVRDGINTILCTYAPQYAGIPSSPLCETLIDPQSYRAPWPNEMLLVAFVKHEGRTSVSYVCPSTCVGELGDAALLPFADIQAQFERHLRSAYAWLDESTDALELDVSRVSLGYYRVPQKDRSESYALIPAWTFEGARVAAYRDGSSEVDSLPNGVLMILSALDGSLLYAA